MNVIDRHSGAVSQRIDLAYVEPFTLGPIEVVPFKREISAGGQCVHLEPKMMQMLVALAREPGRVLSRDDLIECVWDERIVGDASINRVVSLLRAALRDVGGEAVSVETLPMVGYRLLVDGAEAAPVTTECDPAPATEASPGGGRFWPNRARTLAALALLLLVMLVVALWGRGQTSPLSEIRIAMLPLATGEGTDQFYAQGLGGELRNILSRQTGIEVSSSESAGQMLEAGRNVDEIGRRLDADYVLECSLTSTIDAVILHARLIESETGNLVWEEVIRTAPDSALNLPQRASNAIMVALNRPVSERPLNSRVSPEDYSLYFTAQGLMRSRGTEQRMAARQILEQVVRRNPNFADGIAGLAKSLYLGPVSNYQQMQANWETALELAERALEMDSQSVDALKVAGMLQETSSARIAMLKRATELDPGDGEAWYWLAISQASSLVPAEEILESAQRVVAIDPLWPPAWRMSDISLEINFREAAAAMERDIIAASVSDGQRMLAEARLARIEGDLSKFLRLAENADVMLTAEQQRYGVRAEVEMTRSLLDLPRAYGPRNDLEVLESQIGDGEPASMAQLTAIGVEPHGLWDTGIATGQLRALYNQGRDEELVALYEERFGSLDKFVEWARDESELENMIVPWVAANVASAMRNMGRDEESEALFEAGERALAGWERDRGPILSRLVTEARLAAARRQRDRTLSALRELVAIGWPYNYTHTDTADLVPLIPDRLFGWLEDDPELRQILAPVRAHIARERAEVLAQGAVEIAASH